MTVKPWLLLAIVWIGITPPAIAQEKKTREQKVREDRERVEAEGFWIYNDLERGFAEAERTDKPLLVVLRCIPCEECVKLDDDLVDRDPVVRPLLEQFVCVRIVSTNGLDLGLFQYDTDQSFAAFMLNADRTIYGRFGTRSHQSEWVGDVSLPGLAKALQGALVLHQDLSRYRETLAGKRGPAPKFTAPERYPSLEGKYTSQLARTGNVVQSCIHCHQIGDAERDWYRSQGQPIPDEVLYPYPHPKSIGLILDPEERAKVEGVTEDSIAAAAGLLPGDEILRMNGQPLLSIADVQWVLHGIDNSGGRIVADLRRDGQPKRLTIDLPADWRSADDISWRVTSWGLRRMALGGLYLEELSDERRQEAGIDDDRMALRVKHVGEYGAHAAAKQAGFRKEDVVIAYDGDDRRLREGDLLRAGVQRHRPGDRVAATVLRDGKRLELRIPIQP
ncbi:MAG: PDZ domain-containing protein [Planctomycetaceae bacterium]|nr:MAG: PDZ domain-containing protein [Planctomycetaceae bacterium]